MRRLLITLGALTFLIACGPKEVGAECQSGAVNDDCVEGAVCTLARAESPVIPDEPNSDRFFCRTTCDTDANCDSSFECVQAVGTMQRSCQPRSGMMMTDPDAGM